MTPLKPLPCPVCGREPALWTGDEHSYRCTGIGKYTAHGLFAYGKTPADALKRWNRMVSK